MASRHYTYAVTIAAGVAQANATETLTTFQGGRLRQVTVSTPGVVGTGIAIAFAHQIVIPYSGSQWIQSSGVSQNFTFDMEGYGLSGAWSVFGFNTTAAAVTWNLIYAVEEETRHRRRGSQAPAPIPARAVYAAAERALNG